MVRLAELKTRTDDGQPLITIADVAILNEILIIRSDNEHRVHQAAERQSKNKN